MKGQHAAPQQGVTAPEIVLAGMAVPLALAAAVLCALFLLLLAIVRAARRVPSGLARLERTWLAAALSWGLLLAVLAALGSALAEHAERDPRGEAPALGAAVILLLAFTALGVIRIIARRLGRREVRESGLRGFNPQQPGGSGEVRPTVALNSARLSALEVWRDEIDALREVNVPVLEAVAEVIREAHEREGLAVPAAIEAAARTMPDPPLRLVWNAKRTKRA